MYTQDIIKQAINQTSSQITIEPGFIFLANVMCILHGIKKPTKSRVIGGDYDWSFSKDEILIAAERMKGKFATCSEVYLTAFGKNATPGEARQVATMLRNAGYKMRRSNGRNLYKL